MRTFYFAAYSSLVALLFMISSALGAEPADRPPTLLLESQPIVRVESPAAAAPGMPLQAIVYWYEGTPYWAEQCPGADCPSCSTYGAGPVANWLHNGRHPVVRGAKACGKAVAWVCSPRYRHNHRGGGRCCH